MDLPFSYVPVFGEQLGLQGCLEDLCTYCTDAFQAMFPHKRVYESFYLFFSYSMLALIL